MSALRSPGSLSLPSHLSSDILAFLTHYPRQHTQPNGLVSTSSNSKNLTFHLSQSPALPSRDKIDQLHANLRGNWRELENNHSFIQWLFPIREKGMNFASQPLTPYEIQGITDSIEAMDRLKESYSILLEFYGMRLVDPTTGEIGRVLISGPDPSSWLIRYAHLSHSFHNYLRITRILKCLQELGLPHYTAAWLLFFLVEQSAEPQSPPYLNGKALVGSMDGYWIWCLRDQGERGYVHEMVERVRSEGAFTAEEYREALRRRKETGSFLPEGTPIPTDLIKDEENGS